MVWLKVGVPYIAALALVGCQIAVTPVAPQPPSDGSVTSFLAPSLSGGSAFVEVQGQALPSGVKQFLGIPFAEPPVGDRRFRYASPKTFKTFQTMDATEFPPVCPQNQGNANWYRSVAENFGGSRSLISDQDNISEDCLYLNIWSPASTREPRAVMVWFHGGSNINGWSYEPNYRGHELAKQNVVVVSVQSRLGPLGFLPNVLDEEPGGNFALSDQVVALQWIQSHIAAFGGDPDNVTVFGESAGGGNIAALLSGSAAKGLIHKAIIQSGGSGTQVALPSDVAGDRARLMFEELSIRTARQALDVAWQDYVTWAVANRDSYYHYPIADGIFALSSNNKDRQSVPLLIGTNRHESLMYLDHDSNDPVADAINYVGAGESLVAMARGYAQTFGWSELETADFLTGLSDFHCPALQLAGQAVNAGGPVYNYMFTRERPRDKGIKAYHGAEIPYVFDTHDTWLPTDDTDKTLTHAMTRYWVNFAKTGDPNSDDLPLWPTYTLQRPYTQELGDRVGEYKNVFLDACQLLQHQEQY